MTAVELPTGCQWSHSLEHTAVVLGTGRISVLRPGDTDRACRWAQVMQWHAPLGHTPPGPAR